MEQQNKLQAAVGIILFVAILSDMKYDYKIYITIPLYTLVIAYLGWCYHTETITPKQTITPQPIQGQWDKQ